MSILNTNHLYLSAFLFMTVQTNVLAAPSSKCLISIETKYDRSKAFDEGRLEYKEYADWPERFASPDNKWITLPESGLKYQVLPNVEKPKLNPENLLAQLFQGRYTPLDKISYGSKTVASKAELKAIRLEFARELSDAVKRGLLDPEQLLKFADRLYFKFYLPTVRDTNYLSYKVRTPDDFPQLSYIREFYFEAHNDVLALVPQAAQNVKKQSDFRTLENQALDIIDRIGSFDYLQDYGSGIPSWIKISNVREVRVKAAAILLSISAQRLQQQVTTLTIKELNMLMDEYSRRISKIEKRSTFWMENLSAKARGALTGVIIENKPEVGVPMAALILTMADSINSKLYGNDPILLLYFRTMRAEVARILAQE